jgi:hypothetical protein
MSLLGVGSLWILGSFGKLPENRFQVNGEKFWARIGLCLNIQSLSKHGLETPLKSLFYLFVRVYRVLRHGARSMNTLEQIIQ